MTATEETRFEELTERWLGGDDGSLDELRQLAATDPAMALELRLIEWERLALQRPLDGAESVLLGRVMRRSLERAPAARRLPQVAAVAGALLLLTATAAAAYWIGERAGREGLEPAITPRERVPDVRASEPTPVPASPLPAPVDPAAVPPDPAEPLPSTAAPTSGRSARRSPALGPSALFERAGQERRGGDAVAAARSYRQLQARFPRSSEALASRLSLARLWLTRLHEPERALAQLDVYLRQSPDGPLAPECRYQRALALRRLGRIQAEKEALERSLRRDPRSVYAAAVRARLVELRAGEEGDDPAP